MKKFKKFVSLALASVMALGMFTTTNWTTTAVADGTVDDPCTVIPITKTVEVGKAGTLLPTESFTVTMTPATAANISTADTDSEGNKVEIGPALSTDTITFDFDATDETKSVNNSNAGYASKTENFSLEFEEAFEHTGVYRYYISETNSSSTKPYITYDDTTYVADLYVGQNSDGEFVVYTYVISEEDEKGTLEVTKPASVEFKNIVNINNVNITKQVIGTEYQSGEYYAFRILIPVGGDTIELKEGTKIQAIIKDANGQVNDGRPGMEEDGTVWLTVKGDGIEADMAANATLFYLKDGETLEILGAPVSMIYKVEEVIDANLTLNSDKASISSTLEEQGYTVTYNYNETGKFTSSTTMANSDDNISGSSLKGTVNTDTNTVVFTNTREINTPTGVSIDFLPYAVVMVIAICGSILFLLARKRKH